jgi:drug/metabolite transporter (DMT)-like permease
MISLLIAVLTSALIAVLMRLSTRWVKGQTCMLAANYLVCLLLAAMHTGFSNLFPADAGLPIALGLGVLNGFLFPAGFGLLQSNTKRHGVVLSSVFMKLGLLVPMVVSIVFFREMPTVVQIIGFCAAIFAIILINYRKGSGKGGSRWSLLLLLLAGGSCDAMSKVYEQLGSSALSAQYLFYTFVVAFLLCLAWMAKRKESCGVKDILFGLILGIPNFYSARFLLASLQSVPAVIAYPTFSVGTILVVTLAGVAFFKEKLSRRQWIALGIILLALVLLNL